MFTTIQKNVRLLGHILGNTIAIDHGELTFDQIENIRRTSKDLTSADPAALTRLQTEFSNADEAQLKVYARAFSQFLNLVNIAEQQFTISEKGLARIFHQTEKTRLPFCFKSYKPAASLF